MRFRRAFAVCSGFPVLAALVGASSIGSQLQRKPRLQDPAHSGALYRPEELEAAARRFLRRLPCTVSEDVADLLCKPGVVESFEGAWQTAANFTHDVVAPHPPLLSFTVESQNFSFWRTPIGLMRCRIFHVVTYNSDMLGEMRDQLGRVDVVYGPEGDGLKGKGLCSLALLDPRMFFGDGGSSELPARAMQSLPHSDANYSAIVWALIGYALASRCSLFCHRLAVKLRVDGDGEECEYTFLRRHGWLLVKLSYTLMGARIYREYPLFRPEPAKDG